ncbi:hypothetical protein [Flagellimonas marinaquae]
MDREETNQEARWFGICVLSLGTAEASRKVSILAIDVQALAEKMTSAILSFFHLFCREYLCLNGGIHGLFEGFAGFLQQATEHPLCHEQEASF